MSRNREREFLYDEPEEDDYYEHARPLPRRTTVVRVAVFVIALWFAATVGFNVYSMIKKPVRLASVYSIVYSDSFASSGYILRTDEVLFGSPAVTVIKTRESARVSAGQTVAESYPAADSGRILGANVLALREALAREFSGLPLAALEDACQIGAKSLAYLYQSGREADLASEIERMLLLQRAVAGLDEPDYTADLSGLTATAIRAKSGGLFSSETDGLEGISVGNVSGASPSELDGMFAAPQYDASGTVGKLTTDSTWRLCAAVPDDIAAKLPPSGSINVLIPAVSDRPVAMRIESLGESDGERTVAVLTSNRETANTLRLREVPFEIIFSQKDARLAPADTIFYDEQGRSYVYLPIVLMAREFYVDILAQSGANVIIAPKSDFKEYEEGVDEQELAARAELKDRNEKRIVLFDLAEELVVSGKTLKEGSVFR
ncbi:MAG: hypothetical protein LBO63_03830 [Oscillospiraceae bacterium]|nr:hypothetical protein [Oscillospiraceae bacterium]